MLCIHLKKIFCHHHDNAKGHMQNIYIHHDGFDNDDVTMKMEMKLSTISNMYTRLKKNISDRLCVSITTMMKMKIIMLIIRMTMIKRRIMTIITTMTSITTMITMNMMTMINRMTMIKRE